MYPAGYRTRVEAEELSARLCGGSRPGHFAGVVTVLLKLIHQVEPDIMVMGQKDAQQALIVRRMLVDLDLWERPRLMVVPTVREPDGLAMSSRNRYLTAVERRQAPALYAALRAGVELIRGGERRSAAVRRRIRAVLRRAPLLRPEYVRLVDTATLLEHDRLPDEVLIAVAARLGRARLIDNVVVRFGPRRRAPGAGGRRGRTTRGA
jgi:pantoate--beta-alanine ligase